MESTKEDKERREESKHVIEEIAVEELVEGSNLFESDGISEIKITKDGVVKKLLVPIKTQGVADMIDSFNAKAPQPPVIFKVVNPNDELGKELKLTRKQHVKTFDLTDEDYLEEKEKHDRELGMKIVMLGIAVPIRRADKSEITDEEEKLDALKGMGITGEQFTQLVRDIQDLTRWQEEKNTDFLAG